VKAYLFTKLPPVVILLTGGVSPRKNKPKEENIYEKVDLAGRGTRFYHWFSGLSRLPCHYRKYTENSKTTTARSY
jgi:hypothetical protein